LSAGTAAGVAEAARSLEEAAKGITFQQLLEEGAEKKRLLHLRRTSRFGAHGRIPWVKFR